MQILTMGGDGGETLSFLYHCLSKNSLHEAVICHQGGYWHQSLFVTDPSGSFPPGQWGDHEHGEAKAYISSLTQTPPSFLFYNYKQFIMSAPIICLMYPKPIFAVFEKKL